MDPLATGVLPLCLGEATRLAEYLSGQEKSYFTEVLLGYTSSTYDTEGELLQQGASFHLETEEVEAALSSFRGRIWQRPPRYSALSQGGKRLYALARAGVEVEIAPREVEISKLTLLPCTEWPFTPKPPGEYLCLEIHCSKGTYIRSLVHDLGQALGCGAVMSGLVRLSSGGFRLSDALTPEAVEAFVAEGCFEDILHPLSPDLLGLDWLVLQEQEQEALRFGRPVAVDPDRIQGNKPADAKDPLELLLIGSAGLVAIGTLDIPGCLLLPRKVFSAAIPIGL